MANWNGLILTDAGRNLQAKVEAGQTKLTLTKFKLGNGAISGQQTLEGLADLVSPKQVIGINTCTPKENGLCTITGTIVNTGLTKGYELKELGVFATDPDSGEILYAITTDTHPDYLQPEGGSTVVSAEFSLNIAISNTDKVTAVIDVNGLASIGNVHMLIAEHNRAADAHGNVFDAHNNDAVAHADLLKLFAKLASPALIGTPTAPTAAAATNNTQIATTAFVQAVATAANCGGIVGGSLAQNGWVKFANGLILQWGHSEVGYLLSVIFPIQFEECFTVTGVSDRAVSITSVYGGEFYINKITATYFVFGANSGSDGGIKNTAARWIAIGV